MTRSKSTEERDDSAGVACPRWIHLGAVMLALAAAPAQGDAPEAGSPKGAVPLVLHRDDVLAAFASSLDVHDPAEVLDLVLGSAPDVLRVLPTENYHYFIAWGGGEKLKGNLLFPIDELVNGTIYLSYDLIRPGVFLENNFITKAFRFSDGVTIHQVSESVFQLRYRNHRKTVLLPRTHLHVPPDDLPRPVSRFGVVADESGITFHLSYDRRHKLVYYALAGKASEPLHPISARAWEGHRTGFIYVDPAGDGRETMLASVPAAGVDANSYYDGPFDQIPYNDIGGRRFSALIADAYPHFVGKVDGYGNFIADAEIKLALVSYGIHRSREEIERALICMEPEKSRAAILECFGRS